MTFPAAHIRRACDDARSMHGMIAGTPRVLLDVSHVVAVLDRLESAERECNRLGAEVLAADIDAALAARIDCAAHLRASISRLVSAGTQVGNDVVKAGVERIAEEMLAGPAVREFEGRAPTAAGHYRPTRPTHWLHQVMARHLKAIARQVPSSYRLTLIARYAGDEYADADLCCGDDDVEAARAALARLRLDGEVID